MDSNDQIESELYKLCGDIESSIIFNDDNDEELVKICSEIETNIM